MAIGGEGARHPPSGVQYLACPASRREVLCVQTIECGRSVVFHGIGCSIGWLRHSIASGRGDKRAAWFKPHAAFFAKTKIQ